MAATPTQDPSLLQKMSEEVAPEVSPLLLLITKNAKIIAFVFALGVLGAAGYGGYQWYTAKQLRAAQTALGYILIVPNLEERTAKLESFLASAPQGVQLAANLALAKAYLEAKNYDKALAAWEVTAKNNEASFHTVALIGKAQTLALQEKTAEALAVLEPLAASAQGAARDLIHSSIADLAEKSGDFNKAAVACDALAANSASPESVEYWQHKAAALRLQQNTAKSAS